MTTTTPTITLIGYLGRDSEVCLTTPRDYSHEVHDPVADMMIVREGTTEVREYAKLSLAVHEGSGGPTWYQLRAWNLDDHPDEGRLRIAKKGQRVEVTGFPAEFHFTADDGEPKVFRYLDVQTFSFKRGSYRARKFFTPQE